MAKSLYSAGKSRLPRIKAQFNPNYLDCRSNDLETERGNQPMLVPCKLDHLEKYAKSQSINPELPMPTNFNRMKGQLHASFPAYGWIGGLIILMAEVLLILQIPFVQMFFTPIVWTGYILVVDALLHRLTGTGYLVRRQREFLWILPSSLLCWLIFETYNLHLQNWQYIHLPDNLVVRIIGYVWSFMTIFPAILITSEVIFHLRLFEKFAVRRFVISRQTLVFWMWIGAIFLIVPIVLPTPYAKYLFALVWVGFIFLLDPINAWLGEHSLFVDLRAGRIDRLLSLFLSGAICGLLWEFWNYWAFTKWIYVLPFLPQPKIFEMPAIGFLGFLPFAAECYVMWILIRFGFRRVYKGNG